MAIKVTVGQTTFIKKIVIGTPVTTARESLTLDEFSDFDVGTKSDGQILVYDSAEGAFKNYTLTAGNAIQKQYNASTDVLQIQLDSDASPTLAGLTLNGHLLPGQDSSYDLGDSATKFRDLYLSGSTIHLGGLKLKDSSGGFAVKDSQGEAVNFDLAGSRAQIRGFFSGQGDLTYDSNTGVFQFDVEDVYTKANFDSDFNLALDSAALEGAGLTYNNATNALAIDSSELYSLFKHDDFLDFVADEHVAHSNVLITAGAGLTGGGDITSSKTLDVVGGKGIIANANDIQIDSANIRGMFIANKGLSYDSETGTFNIDSDNIRGMFIGNKGFTYDSELGTFDIDSANVRGMFSGGAGIADSLNVNGIVKIDSSELYSLFNHNDFSGFNANEHINHTNVFINAGKGLTGGGDISTSRTIDVDSANLVTMSRNALSGTNGISYTAGTGVIRAPQPLDSAATPVFTTVNANINADSGHITALSAETIQRTSVVTAATYGSATQIPVLVIDSSGFIDSASTVDVAGVSSTSFDSQDGILTINTADGQAFTTIIADSNFTNHRARLALSNGTGITYNSSTGAISTNDGQIVHDNLSGFVANEHIDHSGVQITAGVGLKGGGTIESTRDLAIDSGELLTYYEPIIRHDNLSGFVANEHIDHTSVSIATGDGLSGGGTIASTRTLKIDSADLAGLYSKVIVHDNTSGFVADEHVAHSGVSIIAGKGLTGGGTIETNRTIDVDSANLVTMSRNALSGANGISYTTGTGVIRAPQPLDSNANPTFNQLRGPAEFIIDPAAIGNATGTVKILGDLQVDGVTTQLNSTTLSVNDKNIIIADSAADSSALSSGGITWGGSNIVFRPSFVYNHGTAAFDVNRNITSTGQVTGATLSGTLATAAQPNVTSLGTLTDLTVDSARITTLSVPESGQVQINCDTTTIGGNGASILSNSALYIRDTAGNSLGFDANEVTASSSLFLNAGASGADVHIQSLGESMIVANGNGSVQLFYNNAQKFRTTDSGVNITGDIRLDNVDFTNNGIIDSARLPLGTFAAGGGGGTGNLDSALAIDLLTKNNLTLGQDVTFDSSGAIFFDQSAVSLKFGDDAKLIFGDGTDLQIYSNGTNSFISEVGPGDLVLQGNNIRLENASNEYYIRTFSNGKVGLYYDNSEKLETASDGVDITGNLDVTTSDSSQGIKVTAPKLGNATSDSCEFLELNAPAGISNTNAIRFTQARDAAGDDWTTSRTRIQQRVDVTDQGYIQFNGADNNYGMELGTVNDRKFLKMVNNGAVEVYYANVKKLETAEGGVTVTGTMNADSATLSGNITAVRGRFTSTSDASLSSTNHAFQTGSTGGYNIIMDGNEILARNNGSSNQLNLNTNGGTVRIGDQATGTDLSVNGDVIFDSAGAILFDQSDQSLNFGDNYKARFGVAGDLRLFHNGSSSFVQDAGFGGLKLAGSEVKITNPPGSEDALVYTQNGSVELYFDGNKKFETTSTGATVTGLLSATTKSFDIEHPTKEGMRLRYGSLEGPENGVYVRGRATSSIIELPEYWTGLVDEDTITVELTPIGKHQKLYVEDIADNKIMIGNDNLINKKINCFYIVYGERKDVDKITVEYDE